MGIKPFRATWTSHDIARLKVLAVPVERGAGYAIANQGIARLVVNVRLVFFVNCGFERCSVGYALSVALANEHAASPHLIVGTKVAVNIREREKHVKLAHSWAARFAVDFDSLFCVKRGDFWRVTQNKVVGLRWVFCSSCVFLFVAQPDNAQPWQPLSVPVFDWHFTILLYLFSNSHSAQPFRLCAV